MVDVVLEDLNLAALDDPDFKEDAVRKDFIRPLLVRLGYASSGDSRIIRSKALAHPFVMTGTARRPVNIIPDYLLSVSDKYVWVLDAKSPREVITSGEHVEQVFSYAIHPEIRVGLFALCNGREFVLFDIGNRDPLIHFHMRDLEENWRRLHGRLAPGGFRQKTVTSKPERRIVPAFDYLAMLHLT